MAFVGSQIVCRSLAYTVAQLYNVYRHLLRTVNTANREHFTRFMFMAIDETCLQSDHFECIVCCDAADHGVEKEAIKLKQMRMPIREVMPFLYSLEQLSMTPSEVENPDRKVHNVMPAPYLMPLADERTEGAFFKRVRLATPAEARADKETGFFDQRRYHRRPGNHSGRSRCPRMQNCGHNGQESLGRV